MASFLYTLHNCNYTFIGVLLKNTKTPHFGGKVFSYVFYKEVTLMTLISRINM